MLKKHSYYCNLMNKSILNAKSGGIHTCEKWFWQMALTLSKMKADRNVDKKWYLWFFSILLWQCDIVNSICCNEKEENHSFVDLHQWESWKLKSKVWFSSFIFVGIGVQKPWLTHVTQYGRDKEHPFLSLNYCFIYLSRCLLVIPISSMTSFWYGCLTNSGFGLCVLI